MAMIADMTPERELEQQLRNRWAIGLGFLWGGVSLCIFGVWFWIKPLPSGLAVGSFIAAGVSLFAALYHLGPALRDRWTRRGTQSAPERLSRLRFQEHTFGMLLILVGVIFLGAALWLGFSQRLAAFGEALSLGFLALLALESGRRLARQQTVPTSEKLIQALSANRKGFGLGLCILGAVLVLFAIVLFRGFGGGRADSAKEDKEIAKTETPAVERKRADFPEYAGVLLLGLIAVGAGAYLAVAEQANIRALVLISGGLAGFVIAVMVLGQAWVWRDVFFGGLTKWRGEEAWKIWVCAYLELFGLILMLGSVMVGRSEVRTQASMRLALYGYNSVLTGLLIVAVLIVLNIMFYVLFPMNFDWTASRGLYALSPSSQDILQKLDQPVNIYVLLSSQSKEYKDVQNLLDNAKTLSDKLHVEYVSPDKDFRRYDTLAQKYPELLPDVRAVGSGEDTGRGMLVVYGPETKEQKPKRVLIPKRKILEVKQDFHGGAGRSAKLIFLAESSLMTELQFFMEGQKKSKVYFLQGDEELDITAQKYILRRPDPRIPMKLLAANKLVDRLKKENIEVFGLSFEKGKDDAVMIHVQEDKNKRKDVPADARAVIIAGPSEKIPQETLDALGRYMEKNGRLIVLMDVVINREFTEMKKTGLEEFLKKYDVDVPEEFAIRLPVAQGDDPLDVTTSVPDESENVLAKKFRGQGLPLRTVRIIRPLNKGDKYKAETLLEVPIERRQRPWAEKNVEALADPFRFSLLSVREGIREPSTKPLSVAVAVKEGEKPRLVVIGDAEFVSNGGLTRQEEINYPDLYFNFLASSLDWLSERPGVGARPKESGLYTLSPDALKHEARMVYLPVWLLSLIIIGLGTGLWVVRRR